MRPAQEADDANENTGPEYSLVADRADGKEPGQPGQPGQPADGERLDGDGQRTDRDLAAVVEAAVAAATSGLLQRVAAAEEASAEAVARCSEFAARLAAAEAELAELRAQRDASGAGPDVSRCDEPSPAPGGTSPPKAHRIPHEKELSARSQMAQLLRGGPVAPVGFPKKRSPIPDRSPHDAEEGELHEIFRPS